MGASQNSAYLSGGPHNKDHRILGSIYSSDNGNNANNSTYGNFSNYSIIVIVLVIVIIVRFRV